MSRFALPADRVIDRRAFIGARWRPADRPARWIAIVGAQCLSQRGVTCRVCADHCGAGAIRFRPMRGGIAVPIVDAATCTGCGACRAPCPAAAIALGMETAPCV